jgi:hypothetical protein
MVRAGIVSSQVAISVDRLAGDGWYPAAGAPVATTRFPR